MSDHKTDPAERELPLWLTLSETAALLRETRFTTARRLDSGEIPYTDIRRAGSERRIPRILGADLQKFMDDRAVAVHRETA